MQMTRNSLQIEASSNRHMMQMRFGQPAVGRAPQARGAYRLRDGPFNASTQRILLHKGGGALLGAPRLQGCMHLWGGEGEGAPFLPARTLDTHRAGQASGRRKADH